MTLSEREENEATQRYLEELRWPAGPTCPQCGASGQGTRLESRSRVFQCNRCRRQFTVTVRTMMERTRVPLATWVQAAEVVCRQPTIPAARLGAVLGIAYTTARSVAGRLRRVMAGADVSTPREVLTMLLQVPKPVEKSGKDGVDDLVRLLRQKKTTR